MKILISFCNASEKNSGSNLLFFDILTGDKSWIKLENNNQGITGISQDKDFFYALFQAQRPGIAIINKKSLNSISIQELPELKDPHSLVIVEDFLFIVSSGTDQVLKYQLDRKSNQVTFVNVFWAIKNSNQDSDTHHINSIFTAKKDIFISAFGPKAGDRWSSAKSGYIYNIIKDKKEITPIYHPHSATFFNNSFFCCESSSRSVKRNEKYIIKLSSGYTRGLCLDKKYLLLGTSSGRKTSKSTGLTNNLSDQGELVENCSLLVFKKNFFDTYKKVSEFNFLPNHKEIYDITILK